jgi:outer membrane biosynthesis protein TonB
MGPIQWIGGGRRKKVSGALPVFPAGVAANAQIKVEAVVAPDGRVRSVRPGQKGNAKWEDAAIRAVQRWKFDKLARSIPQRDHRCVVSFTFSVK